MIIWFSCVVEEQYIKSQAKLVRFASNCNSRGYVHASHLMQFRKDTVDPLTSPIIYFHDNIIIFKILASVNICNGISFGGHQVLEETIFPV